MNAQEFCYWLQGYFELGGNRVTSAQVKMIREHLGLVFRKETKSLIEKNVKLLELNWSELKKKPKACASPRAKDIHYC